MKKYLLLLILFFMPIFVYAVGDCRDGMVLIKGVSLHKKSPRAVVLHDATIVDNQVNLDVKFSELNDYVEYVVLVENNSSDKVEFNKSSLAINSNYIDYSVESTNNIIPPNGSLEVLLKVSYKNEVPSDVLKDGYYENELLNLSLYAGDISNPSTNIDYYLLILVLFLLVFSFYTNTIKNKAYILLFLLLIPGSVLALCNYELKFRPSVTIVANDLNPCTYEGELVPGATYENGEYTYVYGGEMKMVGDVGYQWIGYGDGWRIKVNSETTDPITTKICSSINGKPITYASGLFASVQAESIDLSTFNTTYISDMSNMFNNCKTKNLDLSSFDTSNVTNMLSMFENSETENVNLSSFNTSNVTNVSRMFFNSKIKELNLSNFDTSKVYTMEIMFAGSQANLINVSSFNTSKVVNMRNMFGGVNVETLDISNFDTSKVENISYLFSDVVVDNLVLGNISIKPGANATGMFYGVKTRKLDLNGVDTSNVEDMQGMFYDVEVEEIDLSNFNTSKVTSMNEMFRGIKVDTLDLSNFDTSKVTDMSFMFARAEINNLNMRSFNTSSVTDMNRMFYYSPIQTIDVSSFNTSNVTNMDLMFCGSKASRFDLTSFDMSNVTKMDSMFYNTVATVGLARSQADAAILNATPKKPSRLVFTGRE